VNAIEATWVPKRITASASDSECTGLSGSIGMKRAIHSRTGFEATAAATSPVTMIAKSTGAGL